MESLSNRGTAIIHCTCRSIIPNRRQPTCPDPALYPSRPPAACRSCCTILLWCFVMSLTLVLGWNGSLFCAPCLHKM